MSAKYVLKPTSDQQFMWNLHATNGQVILTSERYTTKASAKGGIASCRVNSPIDSRYNRRTSTAGQPYFNLKASNSQVIGKSEMYSSVQGREGGIASVKKNGPTAPVVDLA